jgi:hypothetical protein
MLHFLYFYYLHLARYWESISPTMYQRATTSLFLSTSHNRNNTQPGSLPPPPPPAATGTTMTDNHHFNPNVSRVNPKDDIAPEFKVIAQDIQNWASCHVGMATTEAQHYCKFFEVVKV